EMDVALDRVAAGQRAAPEDLCRAVGMWHGDVPLPRMRTESKVERASARALPPIGSQHKELRHEPARRATGQRTFIDDQREARNLAALHDEVGMAPEAIEKVIFEPTVSPDGKGHELGHVVQIELNQICDDRLVLWRSGTQADVTHRCLASGKFRKAP